MDYKEMTCFQIELEINSLLGLVKANMHNPAESESDRSDIFDKVRSLNLEKKRRLITGEWNL